VAQGVDHLPSKLKAQSSTSNTAKNKTNKKKTQTNEKPSSPTENGEQTCPPH
jgi:hypothetical protein